MDPSELLRIVDTIHRDKNIDKDIVFDGIEAALVSAAKKHYGEEEDIQVMRLKMRGKHPESDIHPLDHWEMKSLRALAKAAKTDKGWMFLSERKDGTRGGRMSERGFFQIIARAGIKAGLSVPVHPHMLRHGCGFRMNDEGRNSRSIQAWLGHRDISSTQIYCAMSSDYFRREGF